MKNSDVNIEEQLEEIGSAENDFRKTYVKPTLEFLGDLRSLTLGGSPQTFVDSTLGPFI